MRIDLNPVAKDLAIKLIEAEDERYDTTRPVRFLLSQNPHLPPFKYLSDEQIQGLLKNTLQYNDYKTKLEMVESVIEELKKKLLPFLQAVNPFSRIIEYKGDPWGFILDGDHISILRLEDDFKSLFQHSKKLSKTKEII